jgi:hypothetical protein
MNRLSRRGRPPTHFIGRAPAAAGSLSDTKQCATPTVALCFGTRQSVRGGALKQPPTQPPTRPRAIDHTELRRSRCHVGLSCCLGGGRCRPEETHPWQQPLLPPAQLTRTTLALQRRGRCHYDLGRCLGRVVDDSGQPGSRQPLNCCCTGSGTNFGPCGGVSPTGAP